MRHPTIHDIKLTMDYEMPAIDTLMLKLLFLKVVEEGVNIIEAHKQKYRHWTEDPVYLAIARKIFKKVLDVKGICCTLHDDEIPVLHRCGWSSRGTSSAGLPSPWRTSERSVNRGPRSCTMAG